jgi:membrane protein DedA with SNARE-associated domain
MGHSISHYVRTFVADYGYWAVAVALLLENAGIPVPGESTLLLASFLAYSEHKLQLGWIIIVATCAATLGLSATRVCFAFGSRRWIAGRNFLLAMALLLFSSPASSSE